MHALTESRAVARRGCNFVNALKFFSQRNITSGLAKRPAKAQKDTGPRKQAQESGDELEIDSSEDHWCQ